MNHSTPSKRSAPLRLPSIPRGISDFPPILPSLPSGLLSLASSQSGSKDAGHRPKSQIPATPSRSDRSDRSDSRTSHRGALDDFLHLPASPSRPGARASHRGALDAFRHLSASPSRLGHRHVDRSTISCAPTRYTTPTPLNTLEIPATLAPSTKGVMNTSKRSPGSSLSSDTRYQARRVGSSGSVDTESASISKLSPLFGRTERGSQSSGAGPSTRPIVKNENSVSAKTFNQGSNRQWVMTAKRKWKPQPRFTADFLASAVGLAVPRQLELPPVLPSLTSPDINHLAPQDRPLSQLEGGETVYTTAGDGKPKSSHTATPAEADIEMGRNGGGGDEEEYETISFREDESDGDDDMGWNREENPGDGDDDGGCNEEGGYDEDGSRDDGEGGYASDVNQDNEELTSDADTRAFMKDMARSIKKLTQAVASCQEVTTKSLKDFAKLLNLHRGRSGSDSGSDEEIKLPDVKVPSGKIKHRDPIRTALQRSVRVHVMDLLNHPRGLPTPPGDETLSGFRNGLNAGCEIDNFMVDLRDKPACPWNQSAMVVFATDFLASHEIPPTRQNRYQVERAFYTWTRGQHLKYQKHVQTPHLKEQFRKRAGRDQRKRALWHRRIAATTRHPALLPHLAIVKRLNVNGMSSDESELEEGTARKRYYIITPGWRHPSLINFLRALDLVYMLTRINDLGNVGKGNLPHERIPTDSIRPAPGIHGGENATGAVKGLPWNCYNPDWLEQLDEGQIYSLAIQEDEEYDFRHEDRLVELLHGGQAD